MKRRPIFELGTICFVIGTACNALAQGPVLTTLDFPGGSQTAAWGINIYGDVVGTYNSADGSGHGFLWSGQRFSSIDFPGAALTGVYGINDYGDIVGLYASTANGPHHGFVLARDGKFTPLDDPGAASTEGAGINNNGDIAGLYTLADTSTHGFLFSGGHFSNIDFSGASLTFANGINSRGDVVENYTLAGVTHGLLVSMGKFTSIDFPGAAFTGSYGINAAGVIVGRYRDSAGVTHGYSLNAGEFTTVDIPGSSLTAASAINAAGDIVGRYTAAGVVHAFLLTTPPPTYNLTDLGTLPGGNFSQVSLVGNNGLVAGLANMPDGTQHGVLWQGGQVLDIGKIGLGGPNNGAFGINQRGQALMQAESSGVDPNAENFCAYGTGLKCLPALWQGGAMTPLPLLGGNNGTVGVINRRGQAAGLAETGTRDSECPTGVQFSGVGPLVLDFEAVIWGPRAGEIHELPPLPGDTVGMALSINDNGQAVGATGSCANTVLPPFAFGPHAVIWEADGSPHDLGNLGGTLDPANGLGNMALSINNLGQVVGASVVAGNQTPHAFLWSSETGMRDLGILPGDASSVSEGINDAGVVVGASMDQEGNPRGYVWRNGVMTDLNALIPANAPMYVLFASAINSHGDVGGFGATEEGELHAFLATPRPSADVPSLASGAQIETVPDGRSALSENARTRARQRLPFARSVVPNRMFR